MDEFVWVSIWLDVCLRVECRIAALGHCVWQGLITIILTTGYLMKRF